MTTEIDCVKQTKTWRAEIGPDIDGIYGKHEEEGVGEVVSE